jgi:hypothetical protein
VKRDASRVRVDVIRWDYSAQVSASSSQSGWLKALSRMQEEHEALLCLQEMDLEVHEALLAEELERGLHPPNGRDLPAELNEARTCVGRTADD